MLSAIDVAPTRRRRGGAKPRSVTAFEESIHLCPTIAVHWNKEHRRQEANAWADPDDAQRMRLHVDGTRRVLEQMAEPGAPGILASTSGTIVSKILGEHAPYAEDNVAGCPYYASKTYQERLAFEHGERLGIERATERRSSPCALHHRARALM